MDGLKDDCKECNDGGMDGLLNGRMEIDEWVDRWTSGCSMGLSG